MEIERNARAECDSRSLSWMDEQGNFFVTSSEDGFTKLWSISDASSITLRGHIRRVVSCAFSPKGDIVSTGSMDSTIKLWNTSDGTCLMTLEGHEDLVSCVQFDSKGRFLLSGSYDGTMKRWRIMDGRCAFTYQDFSNNVVCIALRQEESTQNEFVACGSGKGTIFLLTTGSKSGRSKLKGHKGAVKQLSFHPVRPQLLCSFAEDSSFRLWDCHNSACVQLVDGDLGRILGFRLLPRTGHLVFASVDTSKEKKKSSASRFALGTLRYLASSLSGVGNEEHHKNGSCLSLVMVGFATNNLYADTLAIKKLPGGHMDKVHGVFFANGSDYFSTTSDRHVCIWNIQFDGIPSSNAATDDVAIHILPESEASVQETASSSSMEDPPFMPAKGAHHVSYYPDKANQEGASQSRYGEIVEEKLLQRNAAARKKPRDKPRRHDGGDGEEIDEEQARVSASVGWSLKQMEPASTTTTGVIAIPIMEKDKSKSWKGRSGETRHRIVLEEEEEDEGEMEDVPSKSHDARRPRQASSAQLRGAEEAARSSVRRAADSGSTSKGKTGTGQREGGGWEREERGAGVRVRSPVGAEKMRASKQTPAAPLPPPPRDVDHEPSGVTSPRVKNSRANIPRLNGRRGRLEKEVQPVSDSVTL